MKIITLTLNPAIDVHCFAQDFRPYHESIAKVTSVDAGGKGVNLSRALATNGIDSIALVVVGKENGEEFVSTLVKEGLKVIPIYAEGRIRENITLHEPTNPETRISFDGFTCPPNILSEILARMGEVNENTIITFTGSIPKGISSSEVLNILKTLKDKGAKVVIDSRSVSLAEIIEFKPWLIKPNKDEAEKYSGQQIATIFDAIKTAQTLYNQGVENVLISLGGDGAVLACASGVYHAQPPTVNVLSTIGAGDSTIAGFIDGTVNGLTSPQSLQKAVAYGTSACKQNGTQPPTSTDVANLQNQIKITAY